MNTLSDHRIKRKTPCPLCGMMKEKRAQHCRKCIWRTKHPWRDKPNRKAVLRKIGIANSIIQTQRNAQKDPQLRREHLLNSYEQVTESGCWIWTHCVRNGYGVLSIRGQLIYAHRFSYEIHYGPIPPDMTIDHLCCVRSCINPDHLQVVTLRENVHRGLMKRWHHE